MACVIASLLIHRYSKLPSLSAHECGSGLPVRSDALALESCGSALGESPCCSCEVSFQRCATALFCASTLLYMNTGVQSGACFARCCAGLHGSHSA